MASSLDSELRDLLALTLVPGMGPRLTAAILERFGSASAARLANADELRDIPHIGVKLANDFAVALRTADVDAEIERIERNNVRLVRIGSPEYPDALATIPDPPSLLYVRGAFANADANAVAIVGSRQCTPYGKRLTEKLAGGLAQAGFTVISGLARGIDAAAHQGALSANGRTLAVLAGGLSAIYPPEHEELSRTIEASGALISETPMAMSPQRGMFHARNRLISGLARAVVVVEANDRSGALITARHAAEQGREVFAVPANADSSTSAGSLRLLRQGVGLIRDVDDLLEDLRGIPVVPVAEQPDYDGPVAQQPALKPQPEPKPAGMEPQQEKIWDFLEEPRHIDAVTRELNLPVGEVSRILMTMELKKLIRRLAGNHFERRA